MVLSTGGLVWLLISGWYLSQHVEICLKNHDLNFPKRPPKR